MVISTLRQRKVAKTIVDAIRSGETPTGKAVLKSANYAQSVIDTHSTKIIESEGVQKALKDYGFTEDNAKKVVASILLSKKSRDENKLKASEQIFKVHGSYAPEKNLNINVNSSMRELSDEELEKLANSGNTRESKENEALQAP